MTSGHFPNNSSNLSLCLIWLITFSWILWFICSNTLFSSTWFTNWFINIAIMLMIRKYCLTFTGHSKLITWKTRNQVASQLVCSLVVLLTNVSFLLIWYNPTTNTLCLGSNNITNRSCWYVKGCFWKSSIRKCIYLLLILLTSSNLVCLSKTNKYLIHWSCAMMILCYLYYK